uniref:Uncharacterized protein n=1 Tax=viral metagenome TaxID=1070528 RepID=A0A6M3L5X1_9ZZZZ
MDFDWKTVIGSWTIDESKIDKSVVEVIERKMKDYYSNVLEAMKEEMFKVSLIELDEVG